MIKYIITNSQFFYSKTWVMKKFGEENYTYTAYFNFEASKELGIEFGKTKDPLQADQYS